MSEPLYKSTMQYRPIDKWCMPAPESYFTALQQLMGWNGMPEVIFPDSPNVILPIFPSNAWVLGTGVHVVSNVVHEVSHQLIDDNHFHSSVSYAKLKTLQFVRDELLSWRKNHTDLLNSVFISHSEEDHYSSFAINPFSFEDALVVIEEAASTNIEVGYQMSLISAIFYADLKAISAIATEISRKIKAIKLVLLELCRAFFCGTNECKKAWFLLHGSHPPDAGTIAICGCPSGCA